MVITLLLVLVAAEASLAVVTLRSRRPQTRLRLWVRAGALGLFVVLLLVGALNWSPRYYALAVWLAVMVVVAAVIDRRQRPLARPPTPGRTVVVAALFAGGAFLATAPALVFPEYSPIPPTGPSAVATSVVWLTDTDRIETRTGSREHRSLTVGLWYPADAEVSGDGEAPLVVFSHGGTGIRTSNESMFTELASHGYVVASIDHTHHSFFTTAESGRRVWIDRGYLNDLRSEDAAADPERSHELYQEWMGIRMADIDFVIDRVMAEAIRPDSEAPYRLIDPERIGVAGHSLGGAAALGVARERGDIRAVIALESPFMADIEAVSDGGFVWLDEPFSAPLLSVYSDSAWGHLDAWPQYARNHELLMDPGPNVHNLHLTGVGHVGLTDLALTSPFLTRLLDGQRATDPRGALERLNRASLEFLDIYLRGIGDG